ncbi:MAG: hypothetical protein OXF61_05090 [Acidimicrobiaceae bacterium]|nr:hypothetical protein [Acidimicrobiaceae bacterium]
MTTRQGHPPASLFAVEPAGWEDNVTDWCLGQFREHYSDPAITKDDIWEYLYGVMHAPDWRERFRHDLQRSLPRVPFAPDFEAFRAAGQELMELHVGYEWCPELPLVCLVDGEPSEGDADGQAYRIHKQMRWEQLSGSKARGKAGQDRSVLLVNDRCSLVGIPSRCHDYTVSGRSPLEWAIDSLRHKHDKKSGIVDDPNRWHVWADEPFELIRHLRRLAHLSMRSAEIIDALPPSLDAAIASSASSTASGSAS